MKECCANCKYLLTYPKNNKYGDVESLCVATGYFVSNIYVDRNTIIMKTPGGRKLKCKYESK